MRLFAESFPNMSNDPATLSIAQAAQELENGSLSSAALVAACAARITKENETLNAFLEVFSDIDIQARHADEQRARGVSHPLLGIPLAIKDNILIEGKHASSASKILEPYVASYDATVIAKLKAAGAVLMGRTNMDEFAMGSSTENSAYGATKNPHDLSRVAGGSSGGSAVAVAADMALGALGSDTGGSVREPASFCGIVGLKPTYGALSRHGLMAMGSSLDQIGTFTKTVGDTEILFTALAGIDPLDSTSADLARYPEPPIRKTIGVPRHLLREGIDADVLASFEHTLQELTEQGYTVVDIELPSAGLALAVYYILMPAEVSANLARFDGVRYGLSLQGDSLFADYARTRAEGFGPEVRRRIMLGTYVLSAGYYDAYYRKAIHVRDMISSELAKTLAHVDVIATPTVPSPAFKIGEKSDPIAMYLADIFTVTANLTGNPALSVPMGSVARDGSSLPVGIQFTAVHGGEPLLFSIGKEVERIRIQ